MAHRYTDVNTRAVYSPTKGTVGQSGKIAKFWRDAAGTQPVDIGLYSDASPDTPGASTGSNQLTVQDDGMWPAMWDRAGTLDHIYLQVGTVARPGDLYRIYCDTDERLDRLEALLTDALIRITELENAAPGGPPFTLDAVNPLIVLADNSIDGVSFNGDIATVDTDLLAEAVAYGPVLVASV